MQSEKTQSKTWLILPLVFMLLAGMLGPITQAQAAQQSVLGGMISGAVSSPGGYPLPAGTLVKLFEPSSETVHGVAAPDLDSGAFSLGPAPNGLYVIKAVPPESSGYTQSQVKPVSVLNAPVNVGELALTEPQVTGVVYAPDGITPAPAFVHVYLGDGTLFQHVDAPQGEFAVGGLPVGSYALVAFPDADEPWWRSPRTQLTISDLGADQAVTLTLQAAQLWGTAQDTFGAPVQQALVSAASNSGVSARDLTGASGFWAIGGLPDGEYTLSARPEWGDSGLLPPEPQVVNLPGWLNPIDLVFSHPDKTVSGLVTTNTQEPVLHAQVEARRVNQPGRASALSQADGSYTLALSPGLWALTVRPITDTLPAEWVYPQPPQLVFFHFDDESEARRLDFDVLTADSLLSGVVIMPDGPPPPFTVTVAAYNDEGVGRRAVIDPAERTQGVRGSFELALPNGGYKIAVYPESDAYLGPLVAPVTLPPEGAYDLGALALLPRDALISGTLTARGSGVAGIPLAAWREGAPGSLRTLSGPDGAYGIAVSAGTWQVRPAPAHDQPYIYNGPAQEVSLAAGESLSGVDFELLAADALVQGTLVLEDGAPAADAEGWAAAFDPEQPGIHNGAPITGGAFQIYLPPGAYTLAAHLPAGSPYISTGTRQVTAVSGETTAITLTVKTKDAVIRGALWDPRQQAVVSGVDGLVSAWEGANWSAAPIESGNGAYRLEVAGGLWRLNYRLDPRANYTRLSGAQNVPVSSGGTAIVPLPVTEKDGRIEGQVLDPHGEPLPGARVHAWGVGAELDDLWFHTRSDAEGMFSLALPYGSYRLGASFPDTAWINPLERLATVEPLGVSGGHVLQFQEGDAVLSGSLTVTNTQQGGTVGVWAWSEAGGYVHARFPVEVGEPGAGATGSYSLTVTSGTTWHAWAGFETGAAYWSGEGAVTVNANSASWLATAELDLLLDGPQPKPAPVVVTFDPAEAQFVQLADGTSIYLPPGALPAEGPVTLRVVPLASLPHQAHADVLRYGYAFLATDANGEPVEAHFNQEVVISFRYDEAALQAQHIHEAWLKPAYFSTTTDHWSFPESYVVDTQADTVTMQIDHFTDFALLAEPVQALFLPLVNRQ